MISGMWLSLKSSYEESLLHATRIEVMVGIPLLLSGFYDFFPLEVTKH